MAHWKAWSVYFPSQVEFLDLELIWPLKSQFSQGHFLQLKKWAESQNFDVFWAFGGPNLKIKLTPSIGNSSFCMPFPKMSTFCDSEQSSRVVARGVRPLQWPKPVNCTKNSQMTKFSPNFLKFGMGVPNQVPCSLKEALTKIWSGSGLFRRFSALANLLGSGDCNFDISLKPWHLWKKWRRFFFFGILWKNTSLSFPKFIFDCSGTAFECDLPRCVKQGILSKWSEMKGIRGF